MHPGTASFFGNRLSFFYCFLLFFCFKPLSHFSLILPPTLPLKLGGEPNCRFPNSERPACSFFTPQPAGERSSPPREEDAFQPGPGRAGGTILPLSATPPSLPPRVPPPQARPGRPPPPPSAHKGLLRRPAALTPRPPDRAGPGAAPPAAAAAGGGALWPSKRGARRRRRPRRQRAGASKRGELPQPRRGRHGTARAGSAARLRPAARHPRLAGGAAPTCSPPPPPREEVELPLSAFSLQPRGGRPCPPPPDAVRGAPPAAAAGWLDAAALGRRGRGERDGRRRLLEPRSLSAATPAVGAAAPRSRYFLCSDGSVPPGPLGAGEPGGGERRRRRGGRSGQIAGAVAAAAAAPPDWPGPAPPRPARQDRRRPLPPHRGAPRQDGMRRSRPPHASRRLRPPPRSCRQEAPQLPPEAPLAAPYHPSRRPRTF